MSNYQLHVGRKVVCIKTHSNRRVVRGAVYEVDAIKLCACTQNNIRIRLVGVSNTQGYMGSRCSGCRVLVDRHDLYLDARLFRPLDALTEQVERIEKEGAPVELETVAA